MPLYFFHLLDGSDILLDPDGHELADSDAVPPAALKEARGLIAHDALAGHIDLEQRLEVFDQAGALVHVLEFRQAITIRQ